MATDVDPIGERERGHPRVVDVDLIAVKTFPVINPVSLNDSTGCMMFIIFNRQLGLSPS